MTTQTVESGVAFPELPDTTVSVEATFIESGSQLQQVFIGLEPVIVIQPEYDAEKNHATFLVTVVDNAPHGLVTVLETLLDAAKTMAQQEDVSESETDA